MTSVTRFTQQTRGRDRPIDDQQLSAIQCAWQTEIIGSIIGSIYLATFQ